jgi:hypothetical protein
MTSPLLLLAFLSGCDSPSETTPAKPETERVVISRLGVALSVPPPYAVYRRSEAEDAPWVVDLRPGMRGPKQIILDPAPPAELPPQTPDGYGALEEERLSDGSALRYRVAELGCGATGWCEEQLVGLWKLGERTLGVTCLHQAEVGPFEEGPRAEACLEQLRGARDVPVTDAPPRIGPSGVLENPMMLGLPTPGGQQPGE